METSAATGDQGVDRPCGTPVPPLGGSAKLKHVEYPKIGHPKIQYTWWFQRDIMYIYIYIFILYYEFIYQFILFVYLCLRLYIGSFIYLLLFLRSIFFNHICAEDL